MCCCFFFTVGLVSILYKLVPLIRTLFSLYRQKLVPTDLLSKYGPDSYVLITGSTDGIGKAYAEWFAKSGFNLILWSRSEAKLASTREELLKKYPKADIKTVAKDFTNSVEPEFFEDVFASLNDVDISILVNNVGVFISKKRVEDYTISEHVLTSNVNMIPQAVLSSLCLRRFSKRSAKYSNAVINLSSSAACNPVPFIKLYGASKKFNQYFSEAFGFFYRKSNKVTDLSVMPSPVVTGMGSVAVGLFRTQIPFFTRLEKFVCSSVDDTVEGSLKALESELAVTGGSCSHSVALVIFSFLGVPFTFLFDLFGAFRSLRKHVILHD